MPRPAFSGVLGRALELEDGATDATTGMVTMLLVKTFCAIYICVTGLVGSDCDL